MECVVGFVFLIGMMVFFAIVVTRSSGGRHNRSYRQLATRYAGLYLTRGLMNRPAMRFRYGEQSAQVEARKNRQWGRHTVLAIGWDDRSLHCLVVAGEPDSLGWAGWGLKAATTGDAEFDSQFTVLSNDPSAAAQLLSNGVRWQIARLAHLTPSRDVEVHWRNGELQCRKHQWLEDYQTLETFCRLSLELYSQALLSQTDGIEFTDSAEAQPIEDVECQVCGEPIVVDMVFCSRCKTPHHRDCWEFFGACSVFGCQETRFITPRVATPVDAPNPGKPR